MAILLISAIELDEMIQTDLTLRFNGDWKMTLFDD